MLILCNGKMYMVFNIYSIYAETYADYSYPDAQFYYLVSNLRFSAMTTYGDVQIHCVWNRIEEYIIKQHCSNLTLSNLAQGRFFLSKIFLQFWR